MQIIQPATYQTRLTVVEISCELARLSKLQESTLEKKIPVSIFVKSPKRSCLHEQIWKKDIESDRLLLQGNRYNKHVMASGFILKTENGFLFFVEEGAAIDSHYYLRMLKKHLYVIRWLSGGWKFTAQQHVARCHRANLYTNYINENVQNYIKKEIWPPNLCDLMEKIGCKNVKRYEDIKVLPAAIPIAWERLTKKFINNSIVQWRMFACAYHVTYTFRVNPHSRVVWTSRNSLLEAGAKSEV